MAHVSGVSSQTTSELTRLFNHRSGRLDDVLVLSNGARFRNTVFDGVV